MYLTERQSIVSAEELTDEELRAVIDALCERLGVAIVATQTPDYRIVALKAKEGD